MTTRAKALSEVRAGALKTLRPPKRRANLLTVPAWAVLVSQAMLVVGCAYPERSRDLGDPSVSATTLAQQVCSNCHGVSGVAVSPNFPNLAAQTEPYLVEQLNAFKSHGRQDPAGFEYMWGLSRGLSEDQIKGLAAYYAMQAPPRQPVEGDPARIEAGKAIFEGSLSAEGVPACASCHGGNGQGDDKVPRLAGQHADYVMKQLMVFQRGDERPEGAVMKVVAHALTRQDVESVAYYAQSIGR